MRNEITQQELYKMVLKYFRQQISVPRAQIQMLGVIHGVDQEAKFLATGQRDGGGYRRLREGRQGQHGATVIGRAGQDERAPVQAARQTAPNAPCSPR